MESKMSKSELYLASTKEEQQFYDDVRSILQTARNSAYKSVNSIMSKAYWDIGKRIVEQEQNGTDRAKYGDYIIRKLSKELSGEFGTGFSIANLKNCRQFYRTFPKDSIGYTACSQLSWSHLRNIMRLDSEEERNYYIQEAIRGSWSVKLLERNIKSGYYRRILSTQLQDLSAENYEFVKDPYVLEFMGLPENYEYKESELERAILSHIQRFLLELGRGFSFVARQMRISTETSDFFLDLVFYNYILKCFVIIDLKTDKLTHQGIGQMDMYVRMFDDLKRAQDDNPTIGIILCTDKDETIVKYSVLNDSKQIFASKYMTVLPTEEELAYELERNQSMLMDNVSQTKE
ncbi:MAG: PDDEXK nuclease domain-containing protein [Enterocloster aldenensis]